MISVVISLLAAIVFFRSARSRRLKAFKWATIGAGCVLVPGLALGVVWKMLILPTLPESGFAIEHFMLTNLLYSSLTLVVELVIVFRVHARYLGVAPDTGAAG